MANNRMYLVCLHCLYDDHTGLDDCRVYLAKYYPKTGWYVRDPKAVAWLDEFFQHHRHKDTWEEGMWGDHFTIVTESLLRDGDEAVAQKRQVLEAVARAMSEGKAGK